MDVDIGKSCKTGEFHKQLPKQYLNVGIAEQTQPVLRQPCDLRKSPVCSDLRGIRFPEDVDHPPEICYPKLNVKIACSHGGVTPANDGASHQSIEDIGIPAPYPT